MYEMNITSDGDQSLERRKYQEGQGDSGGRGGAILCGMSEKSSLISDTGADAQIKQGREWAQRASREKHQGQREQTCQEPRGRMLGMFWVQEAPWG